MINSRFRPILIEMLADLLTCWQKKATELIRTESAYQITLKYWQEVKNECWKNSFISDEEEIDFFRNVKPQFKSRIVYYSILYKALQALPEDNDKAGDFWKSEMNRYDHFRETHKEFICYIERDEQTNDEKYFLRRNKDKFGPFNSIIDDCAYSANYDSLIINFIAEKTYREYVLSQIH